LFEPTFGVLRLSTIVLVMLSGLAFYGLCRELLLPALFAVLLPVSAVRSSRLTMPAVGLVAVWSLV